MTVIKPDRHAVDRRRDGLTYEDVISLFRADIGIDLRLHTYASGGISRYARRLAREMVHLLPPERLTLIPHRREPDPLSLDSVHAYAAWTPPHHRFERWTLGLELLPLGLDLLHSTDFIPPRWGARRHVITIHDLNFLYYPQYLTSEARRYYNDQIGWAVRHADAILADSYATREDLHTLLGVSPERVTVAHLAADEAFVSLPEDRVRKVLDRYALDPGYFLFVGVWEPRKNLPGLFEALTLLRDRGYDRKLVVVGRPGWLYQEIFDAVESLDLETTVHFLENLAFDELIAVYNGAIALVLPSFYEGFGFPALEAMQCGIPAIVANRASLPEVVGDAGLLVDPEDPDTIADACERILTDSTLRAALRQAGLARAGQFTWRKTAEITAEVYRSVLSS
jgi:glycosyltransferase involved in cell wall biosynthesis